MHFSLFIPMNLSFTCFELHSDRVSSYSTQMNGKYHLLHIQ